jgi:hypothetical protein
MSTCVFYIDESGSKDPYSIPIRSGETAIFCLFALALPLADWRDFDREYLRLKRHFFEKEISGSKNRAEHWEIKGNKLCSPGNKESQRNHAFLRRVFDLCDRFDATAFAVTFLKDHTMPMSPEARYCMGLQFLAERFNIFIAENNTYEHGLLIVDSRRKYLDFNVSASYASYIFGHQNGRSLTHLVESPLFADSRLTAGLQIADNVAGTLFANHYHYYCRNIPGAPDYSHIPPRYWSRLDSLQFKSKQRYEGYVKYGFKVCDHRPSP